MFIDGIYISNQWVAEVDFALTFQGNDITKPDERRASYSNSFSIPDTQAMRDLTGGAEQPDAGGKTVYYKLPAYLIENGEVLFYGLCEFTLFKSGWSINLLDALIGFFDYIKERKITSDLDLSYLNHTWSVDTINSLAGNRSGIVYPIIDSGALEGGSLPYDTICPAVYYKTIVGEIIKQANYKPVGKWITDPIYNAMSLPFVGSEPIAYDSDWIEARSARVTVNNRTEYGKTINHIVPYTVDNDFQSGFTDGKVDNFKPSKNAYVPDVNMRLRVQAFQSYDVYVVDGTIESRLSILRNGIEVAHTYVNHVAPYNILGTKRDTIEIDETIVCRKDDEIKIKWQFGKRTVICIWRVNLVESSDNTWCSFSPSPIVEFGDVWPVTKNLPDLSFTDIMLTLAKIMCATYEVKDDLRTIELIPFNRIVENKPIGRDWSDRIDESQEPEKNIQFDGYGIKNLLKWKEQPKKENLGYGDGFINSSVGNLPNEVSLFELPFSAVLPSKKSIAGYGKPLLIETRIITKSGNTLTITKQPAPPCIILIEPSTFFEFETKTLDTSGNVKTEKVKLTGNWFSTRPIPVRLPTNNFSLAFGRVKKQTEPDLINQYFKPLLKILESPRIFSIYMYLSPTDIATLNLSIPIIISRVRVGSMDFNFGYYFINKIGNYRANVSCPVTLISL